MLDFNLDENCYGCGACSNICPTNAIKIKTSQNGFYIPEIDSNICIKCKKCESVCIYLNKKQQKQPRIAQYGCYAAFEINEKERMKSASGGIFFPMALEIIRQNGFVCGCIWENKKAIHMVSNKITDVRKMCNSKYVQSDISYCLKEIKNIAKKGKKVLFTGTPCQCAACKSVVGESANLILISIICEGVPSPKVWNYYCTEKENQYNSIMTDSINFRNKKPIGWTLPYTKINFKNGSKINEISFHENLYVLGLLQGLTYCKTCYHCHYKGNNNYADIIIGDLWKVNFHLLKKSKNKGISCVILNTVAGQNLFNSTIKYFYIQKYSLEKIMADNPPLKKPSLENKNRADFFSNLDKIPIGKNLSLHVNYNSKNVFLKKFLIKVGLYSFLRNINHIFRDFRLKASLHNNDIKP